MSGHSNSSRQPQPNRRHNNNNNNSDRAPPATRPAPKKKPEKKKPEKKKPVKKEPVKKAAAAANLDALSLGDAAYTVPDLSHLSPSERTAYNKQVFAKMRHFCGPAGEPRFNMFHAFSMQFMSGEINSRAYHDLYMQMFTPSNIYWLCELAALLPDSQAKKRVELEAAIWCARGRKAQGIEDVMFAIAETDVKEHHRLAKKNGAKRSSKKTNEDAAVGGGGGRGGGARSSLSLRSQNANAQLKGRAENAGELWNMSFIDHCDYMYAPIWG